MNVKLSYGSLVMCAILCCIFEKRPIWHPKKVMEGSSFRVSPLKTGQQMNTLERAALAALSKKAATGHLGTLKALSNAGASLAMKKVWPAQPVRRFTTLCKRQMYIKFLLFFQNQLILCRLAIGSPQNLEFRLQLQSVEGPHQW